MVKKTVNKISRRRKREKPNIRWSSRELQILLEKLKENPSEIGKPTAKVYFNKMISDCKELEKYNWETIRFKVRNLKAQYGRARDLQKKSNIGKIEKEENGTPIREDILRICPHFDELDKILGENQNIYLYNLEQLQPDDCFQDNSVQSQTHEYFQNIEMAKTENKDHEQSETIETSVNRSNNENSNDSVNALNQNLAEDKIMKKSIGDIFTYLNELRHRIERIEEERLQLEKKKFLFEKKAKMEELELDKQALDIERDKLKMDFEIKKLQIQKDERVEKYEIEIKYNAGNCTR